MKLTRTLEAWAAVDPLYLMLRVASGETSSTAAYNLMCDAITDIRAMHAEVERLHVRLKEAGDELKELKASVLDSR
ncbi:hypothetical protein [Azorhizophilus paspali]|uniref:Uncharacterized protein n=1 Tax=Azorhizophilus paspali TaxID=69963 RepID=A0ABV6SJH9_AZOPA